MSDEGMVMERAGEEGDHCQEDVVVRNSRPQLSFHPVYGAEKSYINVLDIETESSDPSRTDVDSASSQEENSFSSLPKPQDPGAGVSFPAYTHIVAVIASVAFRLCGGLHR